MPTSRSVCSDTGLGLAQVEGLDRGDLGVGRVELGVTGEQADGLGLSQNARLWRPLVTSAVRRVTIQLAAPPRKLLPLQVSLQAVNLVVLLRVVQTRLVRAK